MGNSKVSQTATSSIQNLFQNHSCMVLFPVIAPCLLTALASQPPALPNTSLDTAWSAIWAMLTSQKSIESGGGADATTSMVLKLVLRLVSYGKQKPGSFTAHLA